MNTKTLQSERSYLAPDGSEIRLLLELEDGKGGPLHIACFRRVAFQWRSVTRRSERSGISCKGWDRCGVRALARSKRIVPLM